MDINRAVALAAKADETELHRLYAEAVARGADDTSCTAEAERDFGVLPLLALTLARLPDLALVGHLLDSIDGDEGDPLVARAASHVASGALRLANRALEVHGRDVGYQTSVWVEQALLWTATELSTHATVGDEGLWVVDEARAAALALAAAAAATASDRMLVPEQVAEGLGCLLAIYAIAKVAGG